LGAYAFIDQETLTLRALVASVDGQRVVRAEVSGPMRQAENIGAAAAQELLDKGAAAILADLASSP
jgi:hydroxymethylbilane synthase